MRSFAVCIVMLLGACTASTSAPTSTQTCEQRFDRDLSSGVEYTTALGRYTQCLLDRGDTVRLGEWGRL